jgi:hypothetical protein
MQVEKLKISKPGKGAAAVRKRRQDVPDMELLTKYERSLAQYRQQKLARGDKESLTVERLKGFAARLKSGRSGLNASFPAHAGTSCNEITTGNEKLESTAPEEASQEAGSVAYDGKVNRGADPRAYLPAAWRVRYPHATCEQNRFWQLCAREHL